MRTLTDFADHTHWTDLARERGIKLPSSAAKCSTAQMKRWLWRLGLEVEEWYAVTGYTRIADFITKNPDWPLSSFVGLVLEETQGRSLRSPRRRNVPVQ